MAAVGGGSDACQSTAGMNEAQAPRNPTSAVIATGAMLGVCGTAAANRAWDANAIFSMSP